MAELTIKPYLKAEDIAPEAIIRFKDGGRNDSIQREGDGDPVKTFEIQVITPKNEQKTWTMNARSQGRVAEVYGMDPAAWVNKHVPVYTVKQDVFGTLKDVMYAKKKVEWPESIADLNSAAAK